MKKQMKVLREKLEQSENAHKARDEQAVVHREYLQKELHKSTEDQEKMRLKSINLSKTYEHHNSQMEDMQKLLQNKEKHILALNGSFDKLKEGYEKKMQHML